MRLLAIWIDQRSGFKTAKKIIVIHVSYIENDILEQKKITGSGLEGTPKLLKAFFSRLLLCENYETLEVPTRAVFRPLI